MYRLKNQKGFTLIELVIIIVILGILAAVAIPKYQNISGEAREASCRASLGGLRSAITIFYANQAVTTGTAIWPSHAELSAIGTVMEQSIPNNPYQSDANYPDSILDADAASITKGQTSGANCGWAYSFATGEIWANTSVSSENNW